MLKKVTFFGMLFALAIMIASPTIEAQTTPAISEEEAVAAFKTEPPLSQKDINAYIKIVPELATVGTDQSKVPAILKKVGLSEIRGAYVAAKVGIAMMTIQAGEQAKTMLAQVPEYFHPSPEELELVKKNQAAITKAIPQAQVQ